VPFERHRQRLGRPQPDKAGMRAAHDTLVTALDGTDGAGGYGEEQSDMFPTKLSRYKEELAQLQRAIRRVWRLVRFLILRMTTTDMPSQQFGSLGTNEVVRVVARCQPSVGCATLRCQACKAKAMTKAQTPPALDGQPRPCCSQLSNTGPM